jgi:tetratricopeptide (TPR) repeat protein
MAAARRPSLGFFPSLLGLLGLLAWSAACSGSTPAPAPGAPRSGSPEPTPERRSEASPRSLRARLELADRYYEAARRALDAGRQDEYVAELRKAQRELLEATRIDPASPEPHTQMGIITAYLGDLEAAETSFRNALRLSLRDRGRPTAGIFYSNLAHIDVYRGKLNEARRYLDQAIRAQAPEDEIARISVLLSWAQNDMVEARDSFENAALISRPFAETWDGAPLPRPMKKFADFAAVCCANPTCGPHMENACAREKQGVVQRERDLATVRQEMEIERERRAKLKDIYQRRKELEITVDEPSAAPKREDSPPPPAPKP